MTREQFEALVRRLEVSARRHPARYKLRVGLLAALGYAYIFFILALLLALGALMVLARTAIQLVFMLVAVMATVVRSLGVSFLRPKACSCDARRLRRCFRRSKESGAPWKRRGSTGCC